MNPCYIASYSHLQLVGMTKVSFESAFCRLRSVVSSSKNVVPHILLVLKLSTAPSERS